MDPATTEHQSLKSEVVIAGWWSSVVEQGVHSDWLG